MSPCLWAVIILIVVLILVWRQLVAWSKWAAKYKAWVSRNCACQAPGDDPEPPEPGWPGGN